MVRVAGVALLLVSVSGHGTITSPAMRANPSVNTGWCPFCAGSQKLCADDSAVDDEDCLPPTPCWGAPGPTTVLPEKFVLVGDKRAPDGTYWIDQTGGTDERPLWCPGDVIPIRYYVESDHMGVWFWESQRASPGEEQEGEFVRITAHTSVNNYVKDGKELANYFASEDGVTKIPMGSCKDGTAWSWSRDQCMAGMFAETTLALPDDMQPGETVMRWRWYGAMDESGTFVADSTAERSLFVSCKDVVVGTAEECSARGDVAV